MARPFFWLVFLLALWFRLDFFISRPARTVIYRNSETLFENYQSRVGLPPVSSPVTLRKYPHLQALHAAVWEGNLSLFPTSVKNFYLYSGTLAVLALSGQHVWVLFFVISTLLNASLRFFHALFPVGAWKTQVYFRRGYREAGLLLCSLCLYVMSGGSGSTLRTFALFAAFFFVKKSSQKVSSLQCLTVASALLVFVDPRWIFQPSFVLSFCGVFLVFLFDKEVDSLVWCFPILMFPVLAYYFGRISLLAPFVSFFIEWVWLQVWIPIGFLLPVFYHRWGEVFVLRWIEIPLGVFLRLHTAFDGVGEAWMPRVMVPGLWEVILLQIWGVGGALFLVRRSKKNRNSHRV